MSRCKCGVPSHGFAGPQATVRVANHSSKRSDEIVSLAFESPDGQTQLDTSLTTVSDLEPNQQAFGDAPSLNTDLRTAQFRRRVQDGVRTSAVSEQRAHRRRKEAATEATHRFW